MATRIHFDWALENDRDSEELFIYYTLLSVSNSTQNSGKGRDSVVWTPDLSHNPVTSCSILDSVYLQGCLHAVLEKSPFSASADLPPPTMEGSLDALHPW